MILVEVTNFNTRSHVNNAVIQLDFFVDDSEQCSLSSTIGTDNTDFLPSPNSNLNLVENGTIQPLKLERGLFEVQDIKAGFFCGLEIEL